ncbi:hypothetical protein, partial [Mycolicibacterium smegmatis]|uniref:hypothetical protein n=1 Tax=Mycolicibacterium smegmatis TaxID=1772 RepID=UPI003F499CEB
GSDPRSTVGTVTDAGAMLRILFSRLGKPHVGSPQAFSFNVASTSAVARTMLANVPLAIISRITFPSSSVIAGSAVSGYRTI